MNLVEYLQSKGHEVVLKTGKNYLLTPCPHCGKPSTKDNRHFFATEEVGHCFSCGAKANLYQYMQKYGDDPAAELGERRTERKEFRDKSNHLVAVWTKETRRKPVKPLSTLPGEFLERSEGLLWREGYEPAQRAREYLLDTRKFTEAALRAFHVGLVPKSRCKRRGCNWRGILSGKTCPVCQSEVEEAVWWVSIPYLTPGGKVSLVKYRSLPPAEKAFEREAGGDTTLYGDWRVSGTETRVLVVEGELDAIACRVLGETAVAIAGAQNWKDEWLDTFAGAEDVVLAGDADEPGVEAMMKVAEKIGAFRCRVLEWPDGIKDAAEFQQKGGTPEEFSRLVEAAKPLRGRVWLYGDDFGDIANRIRTRGTDVYGSLSGWRGFDTLTGGTRPGELTVVTAETGSGKSMFCSEWALRLAAGGVPSALTSFELSGEDVVVRILSQVTGKSFYSFLQDPLEMASAVEQMRSRPFYFLDLQGAIQMEDLRAVLLWGIVKYGVRFVVLDHLHYFMPLKDPRYERQEIDLWVRTLSQWAREWGVHIALVVHPSKRDNETLGRVEMGDLKGSSGISQEAHNVISLYRARVYEKAMEKEDKPLVDGAMELRTLKVRSPIAREGSVWFWYSRESLTYRDMARVEADQIQKIEEGRGQQARRKPGKKVPTVGPVRGEQVAPEGSGSDGAEDETQQRATAAHDLSNLM